MSGHPQLTRKRVCGSCKVWSIQAVLVVRSLLQLIEPEPHRPDLHAEEFQLIRPGQIGIGRADEILNRLLQPFHRNLGCGAGHCIPGTVAVVGPESPGGPDTSRPGQQTPRLGMWQRCPAGTGNMPPGWPACAESYFGIESVPSPSHE